MKYVSLVLIGALAVCANPRPNVLSETQGNLTLVGRTLTKSYYKSQNSAYYEAAKEDCERVQHGRLVNIQTPDELEEIYRIVIDSGDSIFKIWVGAKIARRPECAQSLTFLKDCWIWDGSNENINSEIIEWSRTTANKPQSRTDRAFLDTMLGTLDYEPNTSANRYLCEKSL